MRLRRFFATAVAALVTMSALALEKVTFTPQWTAQAQFAGYLVALDMGFYEEEGLDVSIVYPSYSMSSDNLLRQGECQFTTTMLLDALYDADHGYQLINLLQTSQQNGLVIVGYNGKNPEKMGPGSKVGIWNAGFSLLSMILDMRENKGFDFIRFTNNVSLFMSGAIDATIAMSYNELLQLRQCNVDLSDTAIYRFADHDYNIPEDGLYTTSTYYKEHPETCKRFARASKKGWQWCHEHPDEALEIVMKHVRANGISTNRVMQKLMLEEVLRLQKDPETGEATFRLDKAKIEYASRLLYQCGLVHNLYNQNEITE